LFSKLTITELHRAGFPRLVWPFGGIHWRKDPRREDRIIMTFEISTASDQRVNATFFFLICRNQKRYDIHIRAIACPTTHAGLHRACFA
jgi:hypothetical protein